jgi:hypothetical protein
VVFIRPQRPYTTNNERRIHYLPYSVTDGSNYT